MGTCRQAEYDHALLKLPHSYRMNMIKSGSGNKKFDMNGQNAKTKLPKACPY